MRRLAHLLLVVLAAFAVPGRAQAVADTPQIDLSIEPADGGEVGLNMTVRLSLTGEVDCTLIETPTVAGARLTKSSGPNVRMLSSFDRGRMTHSTRTDWEFDLVWSGWLFTGGGEATFRPVWRRVNRFKSLMAAASSDAAPSP